MGIEPIQSSSAGCRLNRSATPALLELDISAIAWWFVCVSMRSISSMHACIYKNLKRGDPNQPNSQFHPHLSSLIVCSRQVPKWEERRSVNSCTVKNQMDHGSVAGTAASNIRIPKKQLIMRIKCMETAATRTQKKEREGLQRLQVEHVSSFILPSLTFLSSFSGMHAPSYSPHRSTVALENQDVHFLGEHNSAITEQNFTPCSLYYLDISE